MKKCKKDFELELSSGDTVEVTVNVTGEFDDLWDGDSGEGKWLIDSWGYETSEDTQLSPEDAEELAEKVEEKVFEEKWDFENAEDSDDESDELDS